MNTVSNLNTIPEHLAVREGLHLNTSSGLNTIPEHVAVREGLHLNLVSGLNIIPEHVGVREDVFCQFGPDLAHLSTKPLVWDFLTFHGYGFDDLFKDCVQT